MKEKLTEHIESFVDGELDELRSSQIRSLIENDEGFARQVEFAVLIKNRFVEFDSFKAPADIESFVLKEVKARSRKKGFESLFEKLGLFSAYPRRAFAQVAGILVLTVFAGTWAMNRVGPEQLSEYTEAEIAQAEEDIKWVMAFVSDTGLKTGRIVKEDVIVKRIVAPMQAQIRTSIIPNNE